MPLQGCVKKPLEINDLQLGWVLMGGLNWGKMALTCAIREFLWHAWHNKKPRTIARPGQGIVERFGQSNA